MSNFLSQCSEWLQPEEITLFLIRLRRHQAELATIRNYTMAKLKRHQPTCPTYQVSWEVFVVPPPRHALIWLYVPTACLPIIPYKDHTPPMSIVTVLLGERECPLPPNC